MAEGNRQILDWDISTGPAPKMRQLIMNSYGAQFRVVARGGTRSKPIVVLEEMPEKKTPSNCKHLKCTCNTIAPGEKSQECFACGGNIDPNWDYKK